MSFKAQDIYAHRGKVQTKKKPTAKPAKAAAVSKPNKAGKDDAVQALGQLKSLNEFFGGKAKTKTVLDLLG